MASVPSQPNHRQHDSGVIADVIGAQGFPKICREIGSGVENEANTNDPVKQVYEDVIIGFISGVPSDSDVIVDGTLNLTVRELHLARPQIVADRIKTRFLEHHIPVSIILHKNEIRDAVLAVFDNLVNGHERHDLVTLFVIPPVNLSSSFDNWIKARAAYGSEVRGHVQIFEDRAWTAAENIEQKPQRRA